MSRHVPPKRGLSRENVGDACRLARACKSYLLVALKVFTTKHPLVFAVKVSCRVTLENKFKQSCIHHFKCRRTFRNSTGNWGEFRIVTNPNQSIN